MHSSPTELHFQNAHRNFECALGVMKHTQIRGFTSGTEIGECSRYICLGRFYILSSAPTVSSGLLREIKLITKTCSRFFCYLTDAVP